MLGRKGKVLACLQQRAHHICHICRVHRHAAQALRPTRYDFRNMLQTSSPERHNCLIVDSYLRRAGGSVAYTEGTSAVAVQQGPSSKPKTLTLDDEKSARVWADVLSTVTRKVGAGDSAKAPDASADGPLYADDCCELYANRLVVKWYFFPAGSKTVPLRSVPSTRCFFLSQLTFQWFSSIRSASTIPRSELSIANHKGWGMGPDFTVWWACGMDLAAILSDKLRVVVDQGAWPHVGFSCRDRPSFIKALTPLLE